MIYWLHSHLHVSSALIVSEKAISCSDAGVFMPFHVQSYVTRLATQMHNTFKLKMLEARCSTLPLESFLVRKHWSTPFEEKPASDLVL
jgi:hypothetical protein